MGRFFTITFKEEVQAALPTHRSYRLWLLTFISGIVPGKEWAEGLELLFLGCRLFDIIVLRCASIPRLWFIINHVEYVQLGCLVIMMRWILNALLALPLELDKLSLVLHRVHSDSYPIHELTTRIVNLSRLTVYCGAKINRLLLPFHLFRHLNI